MSEQLGSKIKRLREEAKMSRETLAETAGIHLTQLELIESAAQVPSMATLIKLARALQVRLGTILDGQEHAGPAVSNAALHHPVISMSNDNTAARRHLNFFSLAQQKIDRNMDPLMVIVGYAEPGKENLSQHEGEEFIFVLEGEVELRYGSEVYPLGPGESIYYDSLVPHCLTTRYKTEPQARVLAVTYTPY